MTKTQMTICQRPMVTQGLMWAKNWIIDEHLLVQLDKHRKTINSCHYYKSFFQPPRLPKGHLAGAIRSFSLDCPVAVHLLHLKSRCPVKKERKAPNIGPFGPIFGM